MSTNNIEGKVVIITGASSGIGEVTAKLLASKGANVVLGARREDKLKQITDEIKEDGGQAGKMYYQYEIPADRIANVVAFAIDQPEDTNVNEFTVGPTKQPW